MEITFLAYHVQMMRVYIAWPVFYYCYWRMVFLLPSGCCGHSVLKYVCNEKACSLGLNTHCSILVGFSAILMQKSGLNINNFEVPKSGTWPSKSGEVTLSGGIFPPKVGWLKGMLLFTYYYG